MQVTLFQFQGSFVEAETSDKCINICKKEGGSLRILFEYDNNEEKYIKKYVYNTHYMMYN